MLEIISYSLTSICIEILVDFSTFERVFVVKTRSLGDQNATTVATIAKAVCEMVLEHPSLLVVASSYHRHTLITCSGSKCKTSTKIWHLAFLLGLRCMSFKSEIRLCGHVILYSNRFPDPMSRYLRIQPSTCADQTRICAHLFFI